MVVPEDFDDPIYLLVHPAVRRPVMDEDSNDVDVASPGGQVKRGAAFAVSHVSRSLKLEKFQHHVPKEMTDVNILSKLEYQERTKRRNIKSLLFRSIFNLNFLCPSDTNFLNYTV